MRTVTFFAGIVLLSACTKKPSTPTPNPTPNPSPPTGKCILTNMYLANAATYMFDLNEDYITYYYDSSNVDSAYYRDNKMSYKYTYNNGVVSNIKEYFNGQINRTYSITYNSNLQPILFSVQDGNNSFLGSYEFVYNGSGQLDKRTSKNANGNTHTISYHYLNGLLTKVDYFDVDGNYQFYSYTYSNDDNKLVIDNVSVRYLLNLNGEDEAQTLCDGLLNNKKLIASMTREGNTYSFTYQLNAKGYPEKVFCNGNVIMENKFDCN